MEGDKRRVKGSERPEAKDRGGLGLGTAMREEMKVERKRWKHRTEWQSGGWGCHGNGRRGGTEGGEDGMEKAEGSAWGA